MRRSSFGWWLRSRLLADAVFSVRHRRGYFLSAVMVRKLTLMPEMKTLHCNQRIRKKNCTVNQKGDQSNSTITEVTRGVLPLLRAPSAS